MSTEELIKYCRTEMSVCKPGTMMFEVFRCALASLVAERRTSELEDEFAFAFSQPDQHFREIQQPQTQIDLTKQPMSVVKVPDELRVAYARMALTRQENTCKAVLMDLEFRQLAEKFITDLLADTPSVSVMKVPEPRAEV